MISVPFPWLSTTDYILAALVETKEFPQIFADELQPQMAQI